MKSHALRFLPLYLILIFGTSRALAQVQQNSFKISVLPQATQATITPTSLIPVDTTGDIAISLASGSGSPSYCHNVAFPANATSAPCTVLNLTPATTYIVNVTSTDATGTQYAGIAQFKTGSTAPAGGATTSPGGAPVPPTSTTNPPASGSGTTFVPKPPTTPASSTGGITVDVRLQNPLKVDNIKDAVKFFVNTLVKIAIPFIVVFFIWAGLKFILAQGNPTKVAEAKKMFWYTIIGTLLILGAWTITNAIIGTVNSITS